MRFRLRPGVNPIIVKELRSRMRGGRAFIILTAMLLLLGTASYTLYRIALATARYGTSPLSPQIGQTLFAGLAFLELMVICFITPAITAGAISSEREKLTYEMLLATPLRPASILWGKLVSALSYVLLLIFAALPMASLVFIFGGVAPGDMLKVLVLLVAVALTLGVSGIFMSTWLGRTGRATVLSYLVVLALLVGPLFVYIVVAVLRQAEPPREILIPNPMSALFSALLPSLPSSGPFEVFRGLGFLLSGSIGVLDGRVPATSLRPLHHYSLALYAGLALVLYLLSIRLVRPARRWRIGRKEALATLALCLVFGGTLAFAFGTTAHRYQKLSTLPTPTPMPMMMPQSIIVEKQMARAVEVKPTMTPTPTPLPTRPPALISPLPTPTPTLSEEDQVAIYAAVVRQLYTVDHTFGEPPNFPRVYLVRTTDDTVGDPDAPRAEPRLLPESIQAATLESLADLPAEFLWVDGRDQVPLDAYDTVEGGGAIFTLGNIHLQEDGSLLVSGSLYFAMLGAGGRTYVLEQVDGTWQVTGNTGVEWIS